MHKLIEYVCDELEELEKKSEKGGLSASDVQYADTLAHLKKNLLKGIELYEDVMEEGGYSGDYRPAMRYRDGRDMRGMSYARGRGRDAKRDAMGRYSSTGYSMDAHHMAEQLRGMMHDAPDEQTRMDIERLATRIERM